jgi:hypothetical protein
MGADAFHLCLLQMESVIIYINLALKPTCILVLHDTDLPMNSIILKKMCDLRGSPANDKSPFCKLSPFSNIEAPTTEQLESKYYLLKIIRTVCIDLM